MEVFKNRELSDCLDQPTRPEYEPPRLVTYTSEEILAEIGPAQACSPSPCTTPKNSPMKR